MEALEGGFLVPATTREEVAVRSFVFQLRTSGGKVGEEGGGGRAGALGFSSTFVVF